MTFYSINIQLEEGMNISNHICKTLLPEVQKNVLKNKLQFSSAVSKYIDKHSKSLNITSPSELLLFMDYDREVMYNTLGITPDRINEVVLQASDRSTNGNMDPYVKPSKMKAMTDPWIIGMGLLILALSQDKKLDRFSRKAALYLAISIYATRQKTSFPHKPNKQCMDYTINYSLNEKYTLYKYKTILLSLSHLADSNHIHGIEAHRYNSLPNDKEFVYYMSNIYSKVGSMINNIAEAFYDNYKNGNYLNEASEFFDDGKLKDVTNVSREIIDIVEKIANKGLDTINKSVARSAASSTSISYDNVLSCLIAVLNEEKQKIIRLFTIVITCFLRSGENEARRINGKKFIISSMRLYKISNSKDPLIIEIKEILNEWIDTYAPRYSISGGGSTTQLNYRKTIYTYFVFIMSIYI